MTNTTPCFSQNGAIVSIRLRNFMTYTDVVLKPGPNLNMILGPNGTGKSAIVCSVIVGLAGEVALTGRATSPAGLVKKGSDWAITEIELYNEKKENYIVERKITIVGRSESRLDHKSEWKLNGRLTTKTEIQALTRKLNIKVDNLCQFLPQDSVAQFVKMNTTELLVSTLKAAGDNQLVEDHNKLMEITTEIKDNDKALDNLKQECEVNEVNARRLESQVEELREREEMIKKRNVCLRKKVYLNFLEAKEKSDAVKKRKQELRDELNQAESNSEPFKQAIDLNRSKELELRDAIKACQSESDRIHSLIQEAKNMIETRKLDCQREFASFKTKQDQENNREQQTRLKETELESLECRLVEARTVDYTNQIAKLTKEVEDARQKMLVNARQKSDCGDKLLFVARERESLEKRREQIRAIKERILNLISMRRPDTHRVIEWLVKNRDKFRKPIFLPILSEINVKDPRDAALVEHTINEQDLFAFVCQTEEDVKYLTRAARNDIKARVNVILIPDKKIEDFEREAPQVSYPVDSGFRGYISDLIDAPEPIMRYLYGQYSIHKIPVFKECSESQLKILLERCNRFFVGQRAYVISTSRYDGQKMTATDSVRDPRNLVNFLDSEGLRECESSLQEVNKKRQELQEQSDQLRRDEDNLKRSWEGLACQLRDLNQKQDEKRRFEALIKICRDKIAKLKSEKIDIDVERQNLQEAVKRINLRMMKDVMHLQKVFDSYKVSQQNIYLNTILNYMALRNHKLAIKKYNDVRNDTTRLTRELEQVEVQVKARDRELGDAQKLAEEKISTFKNRKLDRATQQKFDSIEENTSDSIENIILVLTAKIQGICRDSSIMSEFNRQTEELKDRRQRIAELEAKIKSLQDKRTKIKDTWVPKLNEVIREIDAHYREFMQILHYGGQVKLDYDSNQPDNFATYGIMIMVKYRDNEQLIPLSSTRQSGGERSVATMIYMLALQTKTTVPFRCVDEINQGMDKENERKVFELLVRTADESSSQYFLVSPKLLSNLPYSEKMRIHVVFNGKKLDLSWNEMDSVKN